MEKIIHSPIDHVIVDKIRTLFQQNGACPSVTELCHHLIYAYYAKHQRRFPWREDITDYRIVVSEIMLQQTQTERVEKKFIPFIQQFPSFETLAHAPFDEILAAWKGLGYNRRARALQQIAQIMISTFDGSLPEDPTQLEQLPGIGPATARSILAFARNIPTSFIETNIRTLLIYLFFPHATKIHDKELAPLAAALCDRDNPRTWYYALMDYGVMLKKTVGNLNRQSAHYAQQSRFEGSDRQLRGKILAHLLDYQLSSALDLANILHADQERIDRILITLQQDDLILKEEYFYKLVI